MSSPRYKEQTSFNRLLTYWHRDEGMDSHDYLSLGR